MWKLHTVKKVIPLFFEMRKNTYYLWKFEFTDENDYNSIHLIKSTKYIIQ